MQDELICSPFPHLIFHDFIPQSLLIKVVQEYDRILSNPDEGQWICYENPLEYKQAYNTIAKSTPLQELVKYVSRPSFIKQLEYTFGLEPLELDMELYGAGLHNHPTGGFLTTHLDYEINPRTFKKRWLNLLIYLNDDWKTEYCGDTELWNADCTVCEKRVYPEFNKALVFQTDNKSWHGVSRPIQCPSTTSRKTIAFYYVSQRVYDVSKEYSDPSQIRWKARFHNVKYPELCEIRSQRVLVPEDYK